MSLYELNSKFNAETEITIIKCDYYLVENLLNKILEINPIGLLTSNDLKIFKNKENINLIKKWCGLNWETFENCLTNNLLIQGLNNSDFKNRFNEELNIEFWNHNKFNLIEIIWAVLPSPFGYYFAAIDKKNGFIIKISFLDEDEVLLNNWKHLIALCELKNSISNAIYENDQINVEKIVGKIFQKGYNNKKLKTKIMVKAPFFYHKVWKILTTLEKGEISTYRQIAQIYGDLKITRAIAGAISHNTIAYLIPCHRIIKTNGEIHFYKWKQVRKIAMLIWEFSTMLKSKIVKNNNENQIPCFNDIEEENFTDEIII